MYTHTHTHTHIYIYISAHQAIQMFTYKKYMYPQANAAPRYKNRLTSLSTKRYTSYIKSRCLYLTPTCSSLRRRWWPTPTCPRQWRRTTHRTLLPRRQASTSHRGQHSCSSHYHPPWWRYSYTLLQEPLILDAYPHALKHVL
jgi:hypothetical protein